MADNNPQNPIGSQNSMERVLRIEGERSASMFGLAVRVARIDARLRDLAGRQGANPRKAYRLASTSYEQAIGMFEEALVMIERDVEITPRRAPEGAKKRDRQPRQAAKQQPQQPASKPDAKQVTGQAQNAAPTLPQAEQPVLSKSQRKNQRKRLRKQQAVIAGTEQSQEQKQRQDQHQEPAPASQLPVLTAANESSAAPAAGALAKAETPEAVTPEAKKPEAKKPEAKKPEAKPRVATAPTVPAPAEM